VPLSGDRSHKRTAKPDAGEVRRGDRLKGHPQEHHADVDKKKRMPGDQPIASPKAEEASRAVREYLQTLDAARSEEESGRRDDDRSIGGGRRKPPKETRSRRTYASDDRRLKSPIISPIISPFHSISGVGLRRSLISA
jgi:hypothetical protein